MCGGAKCPPWWLRKAQRQVREARGVAQPHPYQREQAPAQSCLPRGFRRSSICFLYVSSQVGELRRMFLRSGEHSLPPIAQGGRAPASVKPALPDEAPSHHLFREAGAGEVCPRRVWWCLPTATR